MEAAALICKLDLELPCKEKERSQHLSSTLFLSSATSLMASNSRIYG